jgi:hypothetical protein
MQLRALLIFAAFLLTSCGHVLVGETKVSGRTQDVSFGDIQAVIDLFNAEKQKRNPDLKPYQIRVMNRDEMRVFWYKETPMELYMMFKRKNGHWHYEGDMITTA